ncbi:bicaudal-D-related protein 2-like [Sardina pilchardus]|uniref:bicaudal-D-related protein 2-like n=1 Tax=Sardina pilchardus TaxID=27697 RepID=UPI002E1103E0
MDSAAHPERERDIQPLPVIFAERNVCTPLSILEGLMTPRAFEQPGPEDVPGEGVEIFVSDADDSSSVKSSQDQEEQSIMSESTETYTRQALRESSGHSESGGRAALAEREEAVLQSVAEEGPGPAPQRHYVDGTLPDLLRSGSPLRRRVSSPVSNTLKEVRREVELSRRRSLKLKAQVDKLQNQNDPNWTQQKQQVTEEVESILKLLRPLTDMTPASSDGSGSEGPLDVALSQLQQVARSLAMNNNKGRTEDGDNAVLQQALRDRDEAVAKKKAMEMELLNSKTEMMTLNNQLLEAVQHRLELSLELEAWKEDFQLLLQQNVLSQQKQAEQSQKKGLLASFGRKAGKTIRKPSPSPSRRAAPATPNTSAVSTPKEPVSAPKEPEKEKREAPYRWRVIRRGRTTKGSNSTDMPEGRSQSPYTSPSQGGRRDAQFQTISLD